MNGSGWMNLFQVNSREAKKLNGIGEKREDLTNIQNLKMITALADYLNMK